MRLAFLVLGMFLISMTLRSAQSRELLVQEKAVLVNWDRAELVRKTMSERIDPSALSFRDYLKFQLLQKSCYPLEEGVKKIKEGPADMKDQSAILWGLYLVCSEGALGLTEMHIQQ